jgi:hypothetical protein
MKNYYIAIGIYLFGFIIFTFSMEILGVGNFLLEMFDKGQQKLIETGGEDFLVRSSKNFQRVNENIKISDSKTELKPENSKKPLKLSKEELGRHSWALLHSIAASFPTVPTEEEKKMINKFLFSFAQVYPCKICGKHFNEMLQKFPIENKSREEFVLYLCNLHNKVNKRLGKQEYDCKKTFEIWGGDCGCSVDN